MTRARAGRGHGNGSLLKISRVAILSVNVS
jgi:hypothetical protein